VDVFGAALEARGFLCDAAIAASHELGVFDALAAAGPAPAAEIAVAIGAVDGHRLRALLELLAAIGALRGEPAGFALAGAPPPRPAIARAGWGLLADVIRRDAPLPKEPDGDGAALQRLHHHLASAGADAARELVAHLGDASLLDLGAGAGAYSRAFLEAHPGGRATLVDAPDVLALAAAWLGSLADRARLVAGDASAVEVGGGHGAVLLANLLHLHPPAMCARLVAAAARAAAPGGAVVIKDLRVDDGRAGPIEGLLFALNMAVYTDGGDVYSTSQLRAWLADAGLVDITEHRLAAAPDAIVVIGRKPAVAADSAAAADADAVADELDAALSRTAVDAWRDLVERGALRDEAAAEPEALALPAALRSFLAAAVALERSEATPASAERAGRMIRHYTDAMPRMRVAQLAGTDEPGATLFHAVLDWRRLPRLTAAIDRVFGLLASAGVDPNSALGAGSADGFRAASPTLAALYRRTHYGGFMPLLYGFPADLAYAHTRGAAAGLDTLATIDRYLTAPIVHELCHFAPDRAAIAPPHLDECIGGWLGVHVHPELAYPIGDGDDALYAAPWLAQVGQAIARGFGVTAVVRAHAGGDRSALPAAFVDAAARLGWDDWRARRTLHFLSDTLDPAPWVALALTVAAGHAPPATLAELATTSLAGLALPEDGAHDRAIVEDGLRAMCLASEQVAGSFRTRSRLPDGAIAIDAAACAIIAPGRGPLDPVVPRYWLPPAIAARLAARGLAGYELRLAALSAIPDAAAAICDASPGAASVDFALSPRG
jgi:hypothetical protein